MIDKFLKVVLVIFGILIFSNIVFLDFVFIKQEKPELTVSAPTLTPTPETATGEAQECDQVCLELIKEEVKKAVSEIGGPPTPTATPVPTKSLSYLYLPIGSSGATSNTSWTDIPGTEFYFDLADYSDLKAVRWEINLRSFLAGNSVSARIYDVSNSRAVDGSELSTTSGTSVLLRSSDLSIWRGNNLYRVQAKSSSGNPVYLDAPRLKIILE